jgi:hypothetical protein
VGLDVVGLVVVRLAVLGLGVGFAVVALAVMGLDLGFAVVGLSVVGLADLELTVGLAVVVVGLVQSVIFIPCLFVFLHFVPDPFRVCQSFEYFWGKLGKFCSIRYHI